MNVVNGATTSLQRDGYLILENNTLSKDTLKDLAQECNHLLSTNGGDDVLISNGCVLDIFSNLKKRSNLQRSDALEYFKSRDNAASNFNTSKLIIKLLLSDLPLIIKDALQLSTNNNMSSIFLFNEQYVVKPPQTFNSDFKWHRDGDKQLAAIKQQQNISYISAWVALDDITSENGALSLKSKDQCSTTNDDNVFSTIGLPAGTIVLFMSDTWHKSEPNVSKSYRRAFYAQYSFSPITVSNNKDDDVILSTCIQCI